MSPCTAKLSALRNKHVEKYVRSVNCDTRLLFHLAAQQ